MLRCHRCAAAIWSKTHVPGHSEAACRGHREQQNLFADGWVSLTPLLAFRPGREAAVAATFPERREGPFLVATIGGFGPRADSLYRSWYVRGRRNDVGTYDLVGAVAIALACRAEDQTDAAVAGEVVTTDADAVRRMLNPDGLATTATCGEATHQLVFRDGTLRAVDHENTV